MKLEEYVYVDSRIASVENPLSQIALSLVNYLTYGNYVDTTGVAIPHKSPITGYKSNKNMKKTITESQLRQIVKGSIKKVLKENLHNDVYSVFYKNGDEANDNYLSKSQAMSLAMSLENDGYEVIVARLLPNDEWETIYETR